MIGIDTYDDENGVGYKHIKIKPHIGGNFTHASASLETYYGTVGSSWKIEGNKIFFQVSIPPNTKADVYIPSDNINNIFENNKSLTSSNFIILTKKEGYTPILLGSGTYNFVINKVKS